MLPARDELHPGVMVELAVAAVDCWSRFAPHNKSLYPARPHRRKEGWTGALLRSAPISTRLTFHDRGPEALGQFPDAGFDFLAGLPVESQIAAKGILYFPALHRSGSLDKATERLPGHVDHQIDAGEIDFAQGPGSQAEAGNAHFAKHGVRGRADIAERK